MAVADLDVSAGAIDAPAILIQTGIDCDAVVAGGEGAILDQDIFAGIRVKTVCVRTLRQNSKIAGSDIRAVDRVNRPLGSVCDREIAQDQIMTVDELHKGRAQGIHFGRKDSVFWCNSPTFRPDQPVSGILLELLPVPPCASVSIKGSRTGDRDVFTVLCIDQRRIVETFNTLPAGKDDRKIVFGAVAE